MRLRKYRTSDCGHLAELFYHTVHSVNVKDCTKEQLDVWATGIVDLKEWDESFLNHHTLVAVENNEIVGFGDIDDSGYLDRLFVHQDHQGQGIALLIVLGTMVEDGISGMVREKEILMNQSLSEEGHLRQKEWLRKQK